LILHLGKVDTDSHGIGVSKSRNELDVVRRSLYVPSFTQKRKPVYVVAQFGRQREKADLLFVRHRGTCTDLITRGWRTEGGPLCGKEDLCECCETKMVNAGCYSLRHQLRHNS